MNTNKVIKDTKKSAPCYAVSSKAMNECLQEYERKEYFMSLFMNNRMGQMKLLNFVKKKNYDCVFDMKNS